MAGISDFHNPWRDSLRPASFRGASFKVDVSAIASGRRIVLHEYPKRDKPYAEDLGRRARKFPVTAYLIGPDYKIFRDILKDALEREGPGTLQIPSYPEQFQVVCEQYSISETRERGGYCVVECLFCEAGEPGFSVTGINTSEGISQGAVTASSATTRSLDTTLAEQ